MNDVLLSKIKEYVSELLGGDHVKQWPFHNIDHVKLVVEKCGELCSAAALDPVMTGEIMLAAWFHDTGYIHGGEGHELQSSRICFSFLLTMDVDPETISRVVDLIMATKMPVCPRSLQEKILCDADMYHLSSDRYAEWSDRLRTEVNLRADHAIPREQWIRTNIGFFLLHKYFTDHARQHWNPGKLRNLEELASPKR